MSRSVRDAVANWRFTRGVQPRILIVRDHGERPGFYFEFLAFLQRRFPDVRARVELGSVHGRVRDWSPYTLCTAWVQDPVRERRPDLYDALKAVEGECDAHGVRVLNRVDALSNSVKATAACVLAEAGCRVAKVRPVGSATIETVARDLGYPFFVRENLQHQGPMVLVSCAAACGTVPWERFSVPVAVEFIDTRGADGLYRKYRAVLCSGFHAPLHMMSSPDWEVRQRVEVVNDATIGEETAYSHAEERHAAELHRARRALGFDFCAFDYSIGRNGELVVWEANPYPYLPLLRDPARHRHGAMSRALGVMAAGYLEAAGLTIPPGLLTLVGRG